MTDKQKIAALRNILCELESRCSGFIHQHYGAFHKTKPGIHRPDCLGCKALKVLKTTEE